MSCNSGQRKVFADDMVAAVSEIARKHGLSDIEVHRDADPVLVAVRGCLRGERQEEAVQVLLQVSPDLARADQASLIGAEPAGDPHGEVYRAFDLSEMVARDTAAAGSEPDREDPCRPKEPEHGPIG